MSAVNVQLLPAHYKSPAELFAELGIDSPNHINVEAIAQYCGATILYEPLEGSGARLVGFGDRAIITVDNVNASHARQRFSAAHELGHWMWDRGKMGFICAGSPLATDTAVDDIERRANRYAVELLLPESLFRPMANGLEVGFAAIQAMATLFDTSLQATAIRFVELCEKPCLLVCTEQGKRRWHVRSSGFSRERKLRDSLPAGGGAETLDRPELWFETGGDTLGKIRVEELPSGPVTLWLIQGEGASGC